MSDTITPTTTDSGEKRRRLPSWFKRPLGKGEDYNHVKSLVKGLDLHTVCHLQ